MKTTVQPSVLNPNSYNILTSDGELISKGLTKENADEVSNAINTREDVIKFLSKAKLFEQDREEAIRLLTELQKH